jgi:hypothetical protein
MQPPDFTNFFMASAGAGAALVGLLFVAFSVNPGRNGKSPLVETLPHHFTNVPFRLGSHSGHRLEDTTQSHRGIEGLFLGMVQRCTGCQITVFPASRCSTA